MSSLNYKHIHVVFGSRYLQRWHIWLLNALDEVSATNVQFSHVDSTPLPNPIRALLTLEKTLIDGQHAIDEVTTDEINKCTKTEIDQRHKGALIIDLTLGNAQYDDAIVPIFDGATGMQALYNSLLSCETPQLWLQHGTQNYEIGLPCNFDKHMLIRGLDSVLSRLVEGIAKYIRAEMSPEVHLSNSAHNSLSKRDTPLLRPSCVTFFSKFLWERVNQRISYLTGNTNKWAVAYRQITPDSHLMRYQSFALENYKILPDDKKRFYADPFCIRQKNQSYVFVEEYPYETRKGIISYSKLQADGTLSTPKPVLESDVHMSYPNVFEHEGSVWMIPETFNANAIRLYKATNFPDSWELHAVLIDNIKASDVTLHHDGSRWWMFASTQIHQSTVCDALSLYHADSLTGPWIPHAQNPVVIDAKSARPAGKVFISGERQIWRPAQHCIDGYGDSLTLCEITKLTTEQYSQTTKQIFTPKTYSGFHTLNADGHIECIDLYGPEKSFKKTHAN